jgi:hypothetical protein
VLDIIWDGADTFAGTFGQDLRLVWPQCALLYVYRAALYPAEAAHARAR